LEDDRPGEYFFGKSEKDKTAEKKLKKEKKYI
jgi:hypothetical protein